VFDYIEMFYNPKRKHTNNGMLSHPLTHAWHVLPAMVDYETRQLKLNQAGVQETRGSSVLFLPPYSPDLNPIEMAFSKLKARLRRIGARTFTDMFEAIAQVCDLYSPLECWNYFKAAGYVSG